jgi:F-type H+-transporting ATPase subunit delta
MERQVAARYAEALFSLVREKNEIDRVETDLQAVAGLLKEVLDFARLLEHPEVAEERKFRLLEEALGEALLPVTLSFLKLLVKRERSELLPLVEEEYRLLADEARGIEKVEVSTAVALTGEEEGRLRAALERLTGKKVEITTRLEADILAGVRAQVGHRLIDGSAAGRLGALRSKLREAGGGG